MGKDSCGLEKEMEKILEDLNEIDKRIIKLNNKILAFNTIKRVFLKSRR